LKLSHAYTQSALDPVLGVPPKTKVGLTPYVRADFSHIHNKCTLLGRDMYSGFVSIADMSKPRTNTYGECVKASVH
jgi:hypothetical protein